MKTSKGLKGNYKRTLIYIHIDSTTININNHLYMHPISEAVKLWCLIGCDLNT